MPLSKQEIHDVIFTIITKALNGYNEGQENYIYRKNLSTSAGNNCLTGDHLRIPIIPNQNILSSLWDIAITKNTFINSARDEQCNNYPFFALSDTNADILSFNKHLRSIAGLIYNVTKALLPDIKIFRSELEEETRLNTSDSSITLSHFCLLIPEQDLIILRDKVKNKVTCLNDQQLNDLLAKLSIENLECMTRMHLHILQENHLKLVI